MQIWGSSCGQLYDRYLVDKNSHCTVLAGRKMKKNEINTHIEKDTQVQKIQILLQKIQRLKSMLCCFLPEGIWESYFNSLCPSFFIWTANTMIPHSLVAKWIKWDKVYNTQKNPWRTMATQQVYTPFLISPKMY